VADYKGPERRKKVRIEKILADNRGAYLRAKRIEGMVADAPTRKIFTALVDMYEALQQLSKDIVR